MQDEQLRRLLQQYIFNLEDAQEKAEELSVANEGLQRTAEFFKAVLNCTPHGICLVKKHTFQWCSPAFTDILGWQQQDLHSLSILGICSCRSDFDKIEAYLDSADVDVFLHGEFNFMHKDGRVTPCILSARPLDRQDRSRGHVFSFTDFTELKAARDICRNRAEELQQSNEQLNSEIAERVKAESALNEYKEHLEELVAKRTEQLNETNRRLLQAQKMEAVGTLAGGIAHDFNNLLTGIRGYVSLMLHDVDTDYSHFDKLTRIEEMIKSAADLTSQLLGFARGGKYVLKTIDLNELLQKSSAMFCRAKHDVNTHLNTSKKPQRVEADRTQMEQVLLNLYMHAWQAMPGGGEMTISCKEMKFDETTAQRHNLTPGRYAVMSVSDKGVGMDEATMRRIFEPFFTTKELGRGTGLGLASAYGIIRNHCGTIEVESRKWVGSTFTIYLPLSSATELPKAEENGELLTGSGTILLVDDQPVLLNIGAELLELLGYRVLTAQSGAKAIECYLKERGAIDAVMLDMIMPGLNGHDTYLQLKAIIPGSRCCSAVATVLTVRPRNCFAWAVTAFCKNPLTWTNSPERSRRSCRNQPAWRRRRCPPHPAPEQRE